MTEFLSHVWDYPWAQERRCQRCGKTDADLINFGQAAPCQGAPLQPECHRGAGLADQSDKSIPSDDDIGRAAAWLDCTPHAALPLARLLASAREAGRSDERERCVKIAEDVARMYAVGTDSRAVACTIFARIRSV